MSESQGKGSLYLVDAFALIFQVFHAFGGMSSPRGLPTNALFGVARDMLFLHEEIKPDYLVCLFDGEKPTFRDEIYSEYKANRSAMPDELRVQIEPIHQLLAAMRIPAIVYEGFEADDLIATTAHQGEKQGLDVFICSSDKDCRQLISDRVKIFSLRKRNLLDRDALWQDWGVRPEQVVDFQTLVGDAVDNVKGVVGIGPKTAAKLLQQYQTLDNLVANVEQLKGKQRENLLAALPKLEETRRLVRLETNVPLPLDWEAWRHQPLDAPRLLELFRDWGFHSFAAQVQTASEKRPVARSKVSAREGRIAPSSNSEPSLFSAEADANGLLENQEAGAVPALVPLENKVEGDYQLVDTPLKFAGFFQELQRQSLIAVDLETTGLEPRCAQIVGFSFSWKAEQGFYLPVRGPVGSPLLEYAGTLAHLKTVLEDPKIGKVNQNIKYDLLVLRQQGVGLQGIVGDPMVADYLLNPGERIRNKESLVRAHLKLAVTPIEQLIGKNGPKQLRMDEVPTEKVAPYASQDSDVALRLCQQLEPELEKLELKSRLYDQLEIPLIEVLAELEFNGIRLDLPLLRNLGEKLGNEIGKIEQEIYSLAEEEFNIASLKQLRRILFEKLKLKPTRKTGITGAPSTDQRALEDLALSGEALPKQLLEYRRLTKLKNTYIDTLPEQVNPDTGRVHCSFQQTVAATGRLSSSDPNLQNIPIRSELGGQIRQAFVPEAGWSLLTADYSQIELRLLSHFSGDDQLLQAFRDDHDIHTLVAAQINGLPEEQVTSDMRRMAKTVNFGILYGMSAHGLAQRLQIERSEAETFINAYFARYPKVLAYQQQLLHQARDRGFVATILGRRRFFQRDAIRADSTYQQRNTAEREAINMEIQGSAADLIKEAMLKIYHRLQKENWRSRMLLQIHDELVFEVPPEEVPPLAGLVAAEMTGALGAYLTVPLKVEVSVGPNWLDVEPLLL